MRNLSPDFFRRNPLSCAQELIGCTLRHGETSGIIVETEAYASEGDPACHTWKRQGARDFVAGKGPGSAYVYLNYGMHWLFNFLVKGGTVAGCREGFVLLRALEPSTGQSLMQRRRNTKRFEELCNGPAKLTQALGIDGKHHACNPLKDPDWNLLVSDTVPTIVASTRIGISHATDYPWRFLMEGNPCVSASYAGAGRTCQLRADRYR